MEAAMKFFATDTETVKHSEAWPKLEEPNRLNKEFVSFFVPCPNDDPEGGLDVISLSEALGEANLELYGSCEILVNRLKIHR